MRRWIALAVVSGALALALASSAPALGAEFDKFDIQAASADLSTNEAGAHPDFTTFLEVTTDPTRPQDGTGRFPPYAELQDMRVDLPPGLIGSLSAVDTCTPTQFEAAIASEGKEGCPFSSQVGLARLHIYFDIPIYTPVYNMEATGGGAVARLGFYVSTAPAFVDVRLRSNGDFGITGEATGVPTVADFQSVELTLWGVPGAPEHNQERLTVFESQDGKIESPNRPFGRAPEPFLTNPTSCEGPLSVGFEIDSYQESGVWRAREASLGAITGCSELSFEPSFSLTPTSREAGAPSGAAAELTIPQNLAVNGRATAEMKAAVVRLPEGFTISPAAADGLAACSTEQVRLGTLEPAVCPEASKIATVEIDSPSLTRPLDAAIFQRTPEPGRLTRAWLVADELGVHLKLPGEFQLDPNSGRITSLFLDTPPLPLRSLKLQFKGGAHGVLATPKACGTYLSEFAFRPWSGTPDVTGSAPLTIDQNCGAGGFRPALVAGTVNPSAGSFAPFVTELHARYNEENMAGVSLTLPPGVLAKLAGVPLCPNASAPSGACPESSQVGVVTVATGPGASPLWIPQPGKKPTAIYLAGPYKGGPYSLVVKTPAQAGPFDLGDVVVRVGLQVNPTTTQVTAVSDRLPQILEGVPISYRTVHLELNRPEFALNPTNCQPMQVMGVATSVSGATAPLSSRFQVGDCARLGFKPKLQLSLKGPTKRTGHPRLAATLTMPKQGANIARTKVLLPPGEQIDNAHINNPCTRVQFNANACPPNSVLGKARAFSPLLDVPLEGPVYFRSNGGERELPDVVADLHGPIDVTLVGFVDTKNARLRTTFANVPDAPVSKFKLDLFGGKRGLLVNNRNICRAKNIATIKMTGQNGKTAESTIRVATSCSRNGKKK